MRLRLYRLAQPVTVLGPGRRLSLWVQGCALACEGCSALDTWDPEGGTEIDTAEVAGDVVSRIVTLGLTGLTLTGGEPTDQGEALADLVERVHRGLNNHPERAGRPLDVLMFTGRTSVAAERVAPRLWQLCDIVVAGPYRPRATPSGQEPAASPLLASPNQRVIARTPLGIQRLDGAGDGAPTQLQADVSSVDITLIGLPAPGDLDRLSELLRERGVRLRGQSWQKTQ